MHTSTYHYPSPATPARQFYTPNYASSSPIQRGTFLTDHHPQQQQPQLPQVPQHHPQPQQLSHSWPSPTQTHAGSVAAQINQYPSGNQGDIILNTLQRILREQMKLPSSCNSPTQHINQQIPQPPQYHQQPQEHHSLVAFNQPQQPSPKSLVPLINNINSANNNHNSIEPLSSPTSSERCIGTSDDENDSISPRTDLMLPIHAYNYSITGNHPSSSCANTVPSTNNINNINNNTEKEPHHIDSYLRTFRATPSPTSTSPSSSPTPHSEGKKRKRCDSSDDEDSCDGMDEDSSSEEEGSHSNGLDQDGKSSKKRKRTTPSQRMSLEAAFLDDPLPSKRTKERLAKKLEISHKRVQIWFQNRRAKEKREQKTGCK